MLQFVNKEKQSLTDFTSSFSSSPANKYMFEVSNENLRNNRSNPNKDLFKKEPPDVFCKKSVLIQQKP